VTLNVFFVVSCVYNYKKIKGLRSLFLYSILSLSQSFIGIYVNVFKSYTIASEEFLENSINIFIVLEFIIFYLFLISAIKSRLIRMLMQLTLLMFLISTLSYWIISNGFNEGPAILTVLESYLIILPCLYYYYELFKIPSSKRILDESKFWTITGMLFLFAFLIPIFLQRNNIFWNFRYLYRTAYSITFIGYTILFVFFLKAIQCRIKTTT